jgi:TPR repeat protein
MHADMIAIDPSSKVLGRRYARWSAACARGDADACAFVGMLLEDGGDGLARDDAKSLEWMQRSCDSGSTRACDWVKSRPEDQP